MENVNRILQQQRDSPSHIGPIDSPQSLGIFSRNSFRSLINFRVDITHIPQKFCHFIHNNDLPFLEVNHPPSITARYLYQPPPFSFFSSLTIRYMRPTLMFAVAYLWLGVIFFLMQPNMEHIIFYVLVLALFPIFLLLTNTVDKVDILGARSLIFLRVGLSYYGKQCQFGRNVARLE